MNTEVILNICEILASEIETSPEDLLAAAQKFLTRLSQEDKNALIFDLCIERDSKSGELEKMLGSTDATHVLTEHGFAPMEKDQ